MVVEDQTRVIAFLGSAAAHGGAPVRRIDTHSAVIFLAGDRAWKLKRAVLYDYLDFSTADRRHACCDAEVAINRRTAPSLYRGVVPVTCAADGRLAIGGDGDVVDWLVEMVRFEQELLCDRLAEAGALELSLMEPLAAQVASLHRHAAVQRDRGGYGAMRRVVAGNADGLAEFGQGVLDAAAIALTCSRVEVALDRVAYRLEQRRIAGRVRRCHGDLHLGNVVILDGRPTLFDAIEFNDDIAGIDVLYDVAFLLMDLWHRGLHEHANRLWNAYLVETGDYTGPALMPLFLSSRALVRAKTLLTAAAEQPSADAVGRWRSDARHYVALADRLLSPAPCSVVAIGGLSGSGKTSVAKSIAPTLGAAPGAVILRSDEVRKQLAGVPVDTRLPAAAYSASYSARVYGEMLRRAERAVSGGGSAILDAVFLRPDDRALAERMTVHAHAAFAGAWLDAPGAARARRVDGRRGDASDADPSVMRDQDRVDVGHMTWARIAADGPLPQVVSATTNAVASALAGADLHTPVDGGRVASASMHVPTTP